MDTAHTAGTAPAAVSATAEGLEPAGDPARAPVLVAAMASNDAPSWVGARWIGLLETEDLELWTAAGHSLIAVSGAGDYRLARLLVRTGGEVRGFVEQPIVAGALESAELRALVAAIPAPAVRTTPLRVPDTRADELPGAAAAAAPVRGPAHARATTSVPSDVLPSVTVVLCTHERPGQLRLALSSVLALDYPHLDVLVIDNAPRSDATARVVRDLADPRMTRVVAPRAGLARARNWGLRHARGEIIAFTDDDVVVDRLWIRRLVEGFAIADDVVCVSGMVPTGELRTAVQGYFERRVSWSSGLGIRVHRLSQPPRDVPMFPFQVGIYGTGANFALHRAAALHLGGFDEALGAGARTRGGEDIDMFVRVLVGGHAVAYQPSALVWHRHRAELDALLEQTRGYGVGLGAWLTKVALERTTAPLAWRRAAAALRRIRTLGGVEDTVTTSPVDAELQAIYDRVGHSETRAVLAGPLLYLRSRVGAASRPILLDRRPPWETE